MDDRLVSTGDSDVNLDLLNITHNRNVMILVWGVLCAVLVVGVLYAILTARDSVKLSGRHVLVSFR